ncbi:hypothetical protein Hanom_Chr16g01464681 [Helianthus anomalus]
MLLGKKSIKRPAEFWYAYTNPPITLINPPVTINGLLIPGLIPTKRGKKRSSLGFGTREVADGDGDTGDGGEPEVVRVLKLPTVFVKGGLRSITGYTGFADVVPWWN